MLLEEGEQHRALMTKKTLKITDQEPALQFLVLPLSQQRNPPGSTSTPLPEYSSYAYGIWDGAAKPHATKGDGVQANPRSPSTGMVETQGQPNSAEA
eukprot:8161666-Karenia_brevis.AAC.1